MDDKLVIEHNDNPAKRLLLFLSKVKKVNGNKKMGEALAEIFNVDSEQRSVVLKHLGVIQNLPFSIRDEVKSIEDDHGIYLDKIERVEVIFSKINFDSKWKIFQDGIDEATLTQLAFCSKLLSEKSSFKPLYDNDLSELKDKVQSFKNDLSSFDIEPKLNQLIFEKVNDIERAIFDYQITGSALIQKEIESALGSVAMKPKMARKDVGAVRKFFNFLGDVSVSIHLIEYTPELNEFIQLLLEKGTG